MLFKCLVWGGFVALAHAVFSTVHYKQISSVAGLELDSDFVPIDAKIETILGCALAIVGALGMVKFDKIDGSTRMNDATWTGYFDNVSFRLYNHRAKYLQSRGEKKE